MLAEKIAPPHERGYHAVYRENETNYCPGCGRSHWLIGRLSAECGFCGTALSLPERHQGGGLMRSRRGDGSWVG